MTTITREWLQKAINDYESVRDELPFGLDDYQGNILAALRIALASLEAEAVAYIGKIMLEDITDGARSCGRVWPDVTDRMSGEDRIPLYTAPPAPVVMRRYIFEKWWESQNGTPLDGWDSLRTTDGYCDDGIDGQFDAWSACRAAMLNGGKS